MHTVWHTYVNIQSTKRLFKIITKQTNISKLWCNATWVKKNNNGRSPLNSSRPKPADIALFHTKPWQETDRKFGRSNLDGVNNFLVPQNKHLKLLQYRGRIIWWQLCSLKLDFPKKDGRPCTVLSRKRRIDLNKTWQDKRKRGVISSNGATFDATFVHQGASTLHCRKISWPQVSEFKSDSLWTMEKTMMPPIIVLSRGDFVTLVHWNSVGELQTGQNI